MNRLLILPIVAFVAIPLASCMSAQTPKDAYLNRYAAAKTLSMQCPAYGGYSSIQSMVSDAKTNLAKAQELGATPEDMRNAETRIGVGYGAAAVLTNPYQACNALMSDLAWAGTSAPVIPAKKGGKFPPKPRNK